MHCSTSHNRGVTASHIAINYLGRLYLGLMLLSWKASGAALPPRFQLHVTFRQLLGRLQLLLRQGSLQLALNLLLLSCSMLSCSQLLLQGLQLLCSRLLMYSCLCLPAA